MAKILVASQKLLGTHGELFVANYDRLLRCSAQTRSWFIKIYAKDEAMEI